MQSNIVNQVGDFFLGILHSQCVVSSYCWQHQIITEGTENTVKCQLNCQKIHKVQLRQNAKISKFAHLKNILGLKSNKF